VDDLVERVRRAVASQPFMVTLGVTVAHAAQGEVDLELPFDERLTQQHGEVLTVEYKINLLEPAVGERVIACGRVVRRGGRLTVCQGEAYADEALIATSTTTMAVRPR
jgi:acyl-coenzyme A thioesterase PaaI-like protein